MYFSLRGHKPSTMLILSLAWSKRRWSKGRKKFGVEEAGAQSADSRSR